MNTRRLSVLVGGLTMFVVAALYFLTPRMEMSNLDIIKQDADTLLLYQVNPGESLAFDILPNDTIFYVVSHLMLPPEAGKNPYRRYAYAFEATFRNDLGHVVHQQQFFERSRHSIAPMEQSGMFISNAMLREGTDILADDRITRVPVFDFLSGGGVAQLKLVQTDYPVLLRIYRTEVRSDFERLQKLALTPEKQREIIAENMGLESLDELTVPEQQRLFSSKWIRIEAKTPDGGELPTRRIYYTGFRLPFDDYDGTSIPLAGRGCAAFNLQGPAEAEIILAEATGATRLMYYSVYALAEAGLDIPARNVALQPGESVFRALPEGVQSLMVCNQGLDPVVIRLGIRGDKALPQGFAGLLADPQNEGRYFAVTDTMSISMPIAGTAEGENLRFATDGFSDTDILRLDLRRIEAQKADAADCRVDLNFIDAKGATVFTHTETLPFVHSRFERAMPFSAEMEEERLSDVTTLYLRPGSDVSEVNVQGACIVGARAFSEQPWIGPENNPYTENLQGRIWKYRLLPSAIWHPMMPEDWQQVSADNRFVRVTLQARLEPLEEKEERPPDQVFWDSATTAAGTEEVVGLLEQTDPPDYLSPGEQFWISCEPRTPVAVTLPPDPGRSNAALLEGMYYLPADMSIAGTFTVRLHGDAVVTEKPAVRRGDFRVGHVSDRRQSLSWNNDMSGGQPLVLVRIEPADIGELKALASCVVYKSYILTRIPAHGRRVFGVSLDADFDTGLNIHTLSTSLPVFTVTIDGGSPRRIKRRISPYFTTGMAELHPRWDTMNPRVWIPDMPNRALRAAERQYVGLDGDLRPGHHRISVYNASAADIWVRMFYQVRSERTRTNISVKSIRTMEGMP